MVVKVYIARAVAVRMKIIPKKNQGRNVDLFLNPISNPLHFQRACRLAPFLFSDPDSWSGTESMGSTAAEDVCGSTWGTKFKSRGGPL